MAAFDFPNSASVNDQHTDNGITFKWDGTVWKRVSATGAQGPTGSTGSQGATGPTGAQGQKGAQAYISDAAPSSGVAAGDLWWDSDSGDFSIYFDDGSGSPSAQWVEVGSTGPTGPTGAQGATGSATITSNANNRVITGGSGTNLVGESNLIFDGTKLGIGQSSPATLLNVKGNETAYSGSVAVGAILQLEDSVGRIAQFIGPGSAGDAGVGTKTNHHFQIFAGNSPKVFVNVTDSSTSFYGDVNSVDTTSGGTTSRTLKVGASASSGTNSGTIIINNGGLGNASLQFDYESSAARAKIYTYRSTNDLIFDTSGVEKFRILNSGDLSLRTTTQNAYLGLTANSTAINTTLGSTTGTNPRLYLKGVGNGQSDSGDVFIGAGTGGTVQIRSAVDIIFEVNSDSSTSQALSISSAGNLQHSSASGVSYFNGSSEYIFGSTTSSPPAGGYESLLQVHTSKTRSAFTLAGYNNNAGGPFMTFLTSRSTTRGQLGSTIGSADTLGQIRFTGDNGTNYNSVAIGAEISAKAASAPGSGDTVIAGRMTFGTGTATGGTTQTQMEIREDGHLMLRRGRVNNNGSVLYCWGGDIAGTGTFTLDVPVFTAGNIYRIDMFYSHHSLNYGCYKYGIYGAYSGHSGLQINNDISSHSSSLGGSFTVTRGSAGQPIVITKTAGTYRGTGKYFVNVYAGNYPQL